MADPLLLGLIIAAGVFCASVCQALTGLGFSLVLAPILILAIGYSGGLQLTFLLGTVVSAALLATQWRDVHLPGLAWLFLPAVVSAPLWWFLLGHLAAGLGSRIAGVVAIGVAVLIATKARVRALEGPRGAVLAGVTSGGMMVAGGIGGPPLAMYAVNSGWSQPKSVAMLNCFFFPVGALMLLMGGLPTVGPSALAVAAAAMLAGLLAGIGVSRRVSQQSALRVTLALAAIGGLSLLLRGAAT